MREPAMREIWLLRHGQTDWNAARRWQGHTDVPLNAQGRKQARRASRRLRQESFDAVYASDLGRALETARLAFPQTDPIVDPRLRELHFGRLEGMRLEDMAADDQAAVSTWWDDPYTSPLLDGESFRDLEARLVAWRASLPASGRFLVVTHGGPIRCLLWEQTGAPRHRAWQVLLDNCGLTRFRYEENRVTIIGVNDCSHL